jgi:hypothetical protein
LNFVSAATAARRHHSTRLPLQGGSREKAPPPLQKQNLLSGNEIISQDLIYDMFPPFAGRDFH